MPSRHAVLIVALLALAGCQSAPVQPQLPKTAYIEVDKFVPLDASLLQDCPIAAGERSGARGQCAQARAAALQRGQSGDSCGAAGGEAIGERVAGGVA